MLRVWLALLSLTAIAAARDRIAYIEFYGYQGLDVASIRKALPVHEGDAFQDDIIDRLAGPVEQITGRHPEISSTCCVGDGDSFVTIGLRAPGSKAFRAAPNEDISLSKQLAALYDTMTKAEMAALMKGSPEEDGAPGYRRMKETGARAAELKVRDYALKHEAEVLPVLKGADSAEQRRMAADILGFGKASAETTAALVEATGDPDNIVRNNAARAIFEMLRANPAAISRIPADPFITMVRSGDASDLNKSTLVLLMLTQSRDPQLLARLKSEAWGALLEFASWRVSGWSHQPRLILARIAGIPDDRAEKLAAGSTDEFLQAIH